MQPVIPTMGASGVRALVDRRTTPQAQGAKVRSQGAKVRASISKSVRDAATTFNYNHYYH